MWKFFPGVSKPESKQKVDTRESNKAYDATKRKRTFQPHWLQMYKWLDFDGESQLMSCDWCKKFGKDDTDNFKLFKYLLFINIFQSLKPNINTLF